MKSFLILCVAILASANPDAVYQEHKHVEKKPQAPLSERVRQYRYGVPLANTPSQFHLAFAGPTGMTVAWQTDSNTPTHVCQYGTVSGQLSLVATGIGRTYGYSWTHIVTLPNLAYNTKYYYSCGDATYGMSPQNSFKTGPPVGARQPFNIGVIGDMGIKVSSGTSNSIIANLGSLDFIHHIGDVSYADDAYLYGGTYEQTYADYMNEIEPYSSIMAYMTLPGNHEATCNEAVPATCNNDFKNFTAYRTRFEMPNVQSNGTQNMWYSFDYGMVHFIQVDTETDFPNAPEGPGTRLGGGPFGDQLAWIQADLQKANANRANVPWIIMSGHRPVWYSAGQNAAVNSFFLPLITQYKVDFYFSGHEHNYERYYPINSNGHVAQTNYNSPTAPIYFVNGAAGNVEGHQGTAGNADYDAYRNDQDYGWAKLSFINVTTLHWEFYSATTNKVIDDAYIYKPYQ